MSNEYLKAADDAKRLLAGFAAVATVAAAFEKVGSLKQAQDEAEAAIPKAQATLEAARTELANANAQLAQAKHDAVDIVAKANDTASGIILNAQRVATETAAASEAASVAAKETLDSMFASADARIADMQAKYDALAADAKDVEARAEKARAFIAKLQG